jgi:hypothetical protein
VRLACVEPPLSFSTDESWATSNPRHAVAACVEKAAVTSSPSHQAAVIHHTGTAKTKHETDTSSFLPNDLLCSRLLIQREKGLVLDDCFFCLAPLHPQEILTAFLERKKGAKALPCLGF